MDILVTGGAGFIGSHVVDRLLNDGHRVTVVDLWESDEIKVHRDNPNFNFVKELKLRGVPTTILVNKKGEEFARIIGSIDFNDKKFVKWLSNYD